MGQQVGQRRVQPQRRVPHLSQRRRHAQQPLAVRPDQGTVGQRLQCGVQPATSLTVHGSQQPRQGTARHGPQRREGFGDLQVRQREPGQYECHRPRALKPVRQFADRPRLGRAHGVRTRHQDLFQPFGVQSAQPGGQC